MIRKYQTKSDCTELLGRFSAIIIETCYYPWGGHWKYTVIVPCERTELLIELVIAEHRA
jgi:hypothetical protein